MSTPTDEAIAREPAVEPGSVEPDEELQPPALIVRLRAPDRAVARIIGPITPEHARHGVAVSFGISPKGRLAERAEQARALLPHAGANVLALPHPRLAPPPTRIATSSFDREPEDP